MSLLEGRLRAAFLVEWWMVVGGWCPLTNVSLVGLIITIQTNWRAKCHLPSKKSDYSD